MKTSKIQNELHDVSLAITHCFSKSSESSTVHSNTEYFGILIIFPGQEDYFLLKTVTNLTGAVGIKYHELNMA